MHRYYQKNLKKWHKTLNSYMNYISYELESLTGQSYDTLIQEIWTNYQDEIINVNLKMYSFDHLRMYNFDHIDTCCSRR